MMANPRKFSEKIALHNQKQLEETREFEKIMREVSDATNKVCAPKKQQHLHINQALGTIRATSLPNVNNSTSMELKTGFSPIEDLKSEQKSEMAYRERARSTVGPMRSRPAEKRIDTSPYSGPYLSPPPDTSWRRTHSDSSLHTSSHEPNNQHRGLVHNQIVEGYNPSRKNLTVSSDGIPRSSSEVPRVPGINIFPSQHDPGILQIPIGNNTGSLPDLTNFYLPSPINTPIDQDETNGSPYTNSSQCGSPSSLSPTSLHHSNSGRFNFGGSSPHEHPGPPPQYNIDGYCTQYQPDNVPDLGYISTRTSPSQHQQYVRRPHLPCTQTTNTPSGIPDIVLTDYSNNDGLANGFEVAMTRHFDTESFLTNECLIMKGELDPIDIAGLQILADPNMITDTETEHNLRLDLL